MTTKNMGNKKPKKVSVHQLKHDAFTREFIFNPLMAKRYAIKKHAKKTSTITTEGIIMFEQAEFCHSSNGIMLHPEFLAFYIGLKDGCAKKLLFYILFHVADLHSSKFSFNEHIIKEFNNYCKRIDGKTAYKTDVVKQAIRDLVNANLCISVQRKKFMLNPLIVSASRREQWSLINAYTLELMKKNKDVDAHFFPKYLV
jgi:hypothetical protein